MRLIKNAFAYAFSIATFSITGGEDIKVNRNCGLVSTVMRIVTNKGGDILSYFDKNDETQNEIKGFSLNHILFDNLDQSADRGIINCLLPLENIFGSCKTFENLTRI